MRISGSRLLIAGAGMVVALVMNATAAEYFVSTTGSNSNDGLTEATAFADIHKANNVVKPGDTVTFLDGKYTYGWGVGPARSGTASAWITYRAKNRRKAHIHISAKDPVDYQHPMGMVGKSYIIIDGLELSSACNSGQGVSIQSSHHVVVKNCHCHDNGGAGISAYNSDYVTLEDNICNNNTMRSQWDESGISICAPIAVDDKPDMRIFVRRNICYANESKCEGRFGPKTVATDGNGIIIDWWRNDGCTYPDNGVFPKHKRSDGKMDAVPPYTYGCIVEGNICFDNAGRGIHVFNSDNAIVRYNTLYRNATKDLDGSADWEGDLSAVAANNCRLENNIVYAGQFEWSRPVAIANSSPGKPMSVVLDHTIVFGSTYGISQPTPNTCSVTITGTRTVDPKFVKASTDFAVADFRLAARSPAIDAANAIPASADLDGTVRPQGRYYDIGAYERPSRRAAAKSR